MNAAQLIVGAAIIGVVLGMMRLGYLVALRNHFAAQAMASLLMCEMPSSVPEWAKGLSVAAFTARRAYKIADAMMEARK